MVVRSRRNTERCDWRDHRRECSDSDRGWRGFYRPKRGCLDLQGRTSRSHYQIGSALLGLFIALSPLSAPTALAETAITSIESQANLEAALNAYQNKKYDKALSLGKTAARSGSSDAAVLVGHILRKGESVTANYPEAKRWYDMAAIKGHPDALVALGEMGMRQQGGVTATDAISYLSRAADSGRTDAMRALADLYRTGKGTKADPKQAQYWLEKAAQSYDFKGMKTLGDSLFETDPKAALKAYEKAAGAGDIEAAYIAGVMYAENFDIRPNAQKSADWLRIAAEGGHPAAMADYGLLVYQGVATQRSEKEAAAWFNKSAEKGDSEGQFLYAFTLAKGEGVAQNFEEAYYWVLKSMKSAQSAEGTDFYKKDRLALKERLEDNVNPDIISRAKARAAQG